MWQRSAVLIFVGAVFLNSIAFTVYTREEVEGVSDENSHHR